jgi:hypothetical protein
MAYFRAFSGPPRGPPKKAIFWSFFSGTFPDFFAFLTKKGHSSRFGPPDFRFPEKISGRPQNPGPPPGPDFRPARPDFRAQDPRFGPDLGPLDPQIWPDFGPQEPIFDPFLGSIFDPFFMLFIGSISFAF